MKYIYGYFAAENSRLCITITKGTCYSQKMNLIDAAIATIRNAVVRHYVYLVYARHETGISEALLEDNRFACLGNGRLACTPK